MFSIRTTLIAGGFLFVLGALAIAAYFFKTGETGEPKPTYLMFGAVA